MAFAHNVLHQISAGPRLNIKTVLSTYVDFHVKDKTALGRLIFNMGIAIPGKTVFLIETAPWFRCPSPSYVSLNMPSSRRVTHSPILGET